MSKTAEAIARVVASEFRKQRRLYREGKRGFGDLNKEFANALYQILIPSYSTALKAARAKKDLAYDAEAEAAQHATSLAQALNRSTTRMLKRGREVADVFSADRAALIALDADKRARVICLQMAVESRGNKLQWIAKGPRVCPTCLRINGRTARPGKAFAIIHGVKITQPPLHPHCLLGETPVIVAGSILSTYKTSYNGPVVRIVTIGGNSFTCTTNHQLLSRSGFAAANTFKQGDYIFCCPLINFPQPRIRPDNHWQPTSIEKIVAAFAKSSGVLTSSVPVSPEYLHGDGVFCNRKIDIVRANSFLGSETNTEVGEIVSEQDFQIALNSCFLSTNCSLTEILKTLRMAANCRMSSISQTSSLFRSSSSVPIDTSIFTPTRSNTGLNQMSPNDTTLNIERLRQCQLRLASQVTLTKIISIRHDNFSGHVFDLQTESGCYILPGGVVGSNCYCVLQEIHS